LKGTFNAALGLEGEVSATKSNEQSIGSLGRDFEHQLGTQHDHRPQQTRVELGDAAGDIDAARST
jgi:hypothetical protein